MTKPPAPSHSDLQRAAINALWPALRRRHWTPHRVTRDVRPAPPSPTYSSASSIPGPAPTTELVSEEWYLYALADHQDTRLGVGLTVKLLRVDHDRALARLPAAQIAAYEAARDTSTCRAPFLAERLPDGSVTYRRNHKDGSITEDAAAALEAIARAAEVLPLPLEVEAALFDDADDISPLGVEVSIARAQS